jgi:pyruvate/2-oxoglutarate dehydrogenase complex dihydrolipoamide acyltransferase (E2) component
MMMMMSIPTASADLFTLPDIGEGVAEGEILQWLAEEGALVQEDAPLLEVMTDKVTVEIPAPKTAILGKRLVQVGDIVPVGSPICQWGAGASGNTTPNASSPIVVDAVDELALLANAIVQEATAAYDSPIVVVGGGSSFDVEETLEAGKRVLATPATRKLARTMGLSLATIKGSGENGRVTKQDVEQAFAYQQAPPLQKAIPVPTTPTVSCSFTVDAKPSVIGQALPTETVLREKTPTTQTTERPYTGIRRTIGDRLLVAKKTIPDFAFIEAIDVTQLEALREKAKPLLQAQGVKLSILPFVLKAVSQALLAFPALNAELRESEGKIIEKHFVNLGLAVDTPTGLVVPVLHQAHQQTVQELAKNVQLLAEQARTGKLARSAMQGGSFTVTSIGSMGGTIGIPIINPPEVAIMAVNRIVKQPIVNANDEIVIGKMINLTLTVDHRVVDGADAARFMNHVKQLLEAPLALLL